MGFARNIPGWGMLQSFMHPEDAWKSAQGAAEHGWDEAKGFQRPFMEHGLEQYDPLNKARMALMDPAALQGEWASGYETSPYAKRMLDYNKSSGLDAASAMGLMGSSGALSNIQQGAGDIVSRDRQQYMNDLMQKYMTGIGLGESLYGTGAQAAGNLGQQAMQQGTNMAGLKYGEQRAPGQMFENLLKMFAGSMAGGAGGGMGGGGMGANTYNPGF